MMTTAMTMMDVNDDAINAQARRLRIAMRQSASTLALSLSCCERALPRRVTAVSYSDDGPVRGLRPAVQRQEMRRLVSCPHLSGRASHSNSNTSASSMGFSDEDSE
eukprot:250785-Rhodomonas_salina.1